MQKKIRIETTDNDILIVLKSKKPFDELSLSLSNFLHKYDITNMNLTIDDMAKTLAFLTKQQPSEKDIKRAYEKTNESIKKLLNK